MQRIKNPNWPEAPTWLFTSVAEDLNSGRPLTNPASGHSGPEPGPPTHWPLGYAALLLNCGKNDERWDRS